MLSKPRYRFVTSIRDAREITLLAIESVATASESIDGRWVHHFKTPAGESGVAVVQGRSVIFLQCLDK